MAQAASFSRKVGTPAHSAASSLALSARKARPTHDTSIQRATATANTATASMMRKTNWICPPAQAGASGGRRARPDAPPRKSTLMTMVCAITTKAMVPMAK